jgi:hypothetical protein
MWLVVLLAALPAPIVEGRVGEPSGPGAAGARVTLSQGDRTQVLRTDERGRFRFRAFAGPGSVSVVLPQGWTIDGKTAASFEAFAGRVVEVVFAARARRVLHGRLTTSGGPLPDVDLEVGSARAHTDAGGFFVAVNLPPGSVAIKAGWLSGSVAMPEGPGQVTADVSMSAPQLSALGMVKLPQPPAVRPIGAWIEGRPLTDAESGDIERLAALVNLSPSLRLAMVARTGQAMKAALVLQRYLTGPYLVPRERIFFAVGEVAPAGHLALVLMRPEAQ